MFQKTADDGYDPDIFRQTRDARAKTAGIADDHFNLYPGLRGLVEGLDDVGVLQRVGLETDQARRIVAVEFDFALDVVQQRLLQDLGRRKNLLVIALRLVAGGEVVEDFRQPLANPFVAGKQAEIGIKPGRARMIVAGADMGIAAQPVIVLSHHQDHLAVGLQAHNAVGYMDAVLLQPARPADIGGLVETRLEFDHHGDLLAVARRVDQIVYDPGPGRGAVQGHLDCQNLGILARLAHEALHGGAEGLVGVVQQYRPRVPDDMEDIVVVHEFGVVDRAMIRIVKFLPVELRQFHQVAHAQQHAGLEDVMLLVQAQFRRQHAAMGFGHAARHLHPDDRGKLAVAEFGLDHVEKVVGCLFVAFGVGVPGDPENP